VDLSTRRLSADGNVRQIREEVVDFRVEVRNRSATTTSRLSAALVSGRDSGRRSTTKPMVLAVPAGGLGKVRFTTCLPENPGTIDGTLTLLGTDGADDNDAATATTRAR
jgi:hypothetical protein